VSNAFIQSMADNYEHALRLMDAALTDCPDDVWPEDLWPDEAPTSSGPNGGLHGSAPWFLGYHALSCLDYDLTGGFEPWAPPPPFDDHTYALPNRVFTKPELLGYIDWCRGRVRQVLGTLTPEMAARPLPEAHRYHGTMFGVIIGSVPLHVVEHASQIRQFLTAAGLEVQPMPGDRGYGG
jgi:hypothetical protein